MPRAIKCLLQGCRRGRVRGLDELAFDEVRLDQVSALARGLSEPTREALAAFLASAANV